MGLLDTDPFKRAVKQAVEDEKPDEWAQVLAAIERAATPPVLPAIPAPRVDVAAPDLTPILRAIDRLAARTVEPVVVPPAEVWVDAPDLGPVLEAVALSRLDPATLAEAIGVAIAARLGDRGEQPDPTEALRAVVAELEALRKKFNGAARGGGGGGGGLTLPQMTEAVVEAGLLTDTQLRATPVPVALPGLPGLEFDQMEVTTVAAQVPDLSGRGSISIKALAANGAEVYIKQVSGATTLNSWELSAGDSIDVDANDANEFWLVSSSGTQRVCFAQILETP